MILVHLIKGYLDIAEQVKIVGRTLLSDKLSREIRVEELCQIEQLRAKLVPSWPI